VSCCLGTSETLARASHNRAGVKDTLAKVDQFEADALKRVDGYVADGLEWTERDHTQLRFGYDQDVITELDLKGSGISTVLWANGYNFDFSFGEAANCRCGWVSIQKRGVTDYQGCTFSECLGFTANGRNPVRVETMPLICSPYCGA